MATIVVKKDEYDRLKKLERTFESIFGYFLHLQDIDKSLPTAIQKRIAKKMRFYVDQKDPLRFAKRLTEPREGEFRFRVGDYRIIFDVVDKKIFVLAVKRRDDAYDQN